jgi:predicted transcriptional regulator YheO
LILNLQKEALTLSPFIMLVDFLAEQLGPNHEIVLHDLTHLNHSIIAIRNNNISGREVGGPATDLVLKIMKENDYPKKDYICNYKGYAKGGKQFRSSTFFIRNESGGLIGMLCINSDITALNKLVDAVQCIVAYNNLNDIELSEVSYSENLSSSIEELTLSSVQSIIKGKHVSPERMTPEEKMDIVGELNKKGIFLLKGAVSEVAHHLKTSEATIYRYLQKVK